MHRHNVTSVAKGPYASILPEAANEWIRFGRRKNLKGDVLRKFVDNKLSMTRREIDSMVHGDGKHKIETK